MLLYAALQEWKERWKSYPCPGEAMLRTGAIFHEKWKVNLEFITKVGGQWRQKREIIHHPCHDYGGK